MGRKVKDDIPSLKSITNKDVIVRLNFLYQACCYLHNVSHEGPPQAPVLTPVSQPSLNRTPKTATMAGLARDYLQTMMVTGKKTLVKMDPSVKRTVCKGCSIILTPGLTATVHVKTSRSSGHTVVYRCTSCGTSRRVPAPPIAPSTPEQDPEGLIPEDRPRTLSTSDTRGFRRKKRKLVAPRPPPLFDRHVGHVIFYRDEILSGEIDQ